MFQLADGSCWILDVLVAKEREAGLTEKELDAGVCICRGDMAAARLMFSGPNLASVVAAILAQYPQLAPLSRQIYPEPREPPEAFLVEFTEHGQWPTKAIFKILQLSFQTGKADVTDFRGEQAGAGVNG
jgi:hypothetical protein